LRPGSRFACLPRQYPSALRIEPWAPLTFPLHRPSPKPGRVGSCIIVSRPASAFTHVTALTLAKSPSDPLPRASCSLVASPACSDGYRVERSQVGRAVLPPLWTDAFSRRTREDTTWPPSSFASGCGILLDYKGRENFLSEDTSVTDTNPIVLANLFR